MVGVEVVVIFISQIQGSGLPQGSPCPLWWVLSDELYSQQMICAVPSG